MNAAAEPSLVADAPRRIVLHRSRADRVYRGVTTAAGLMTLVVLFLIGLFLLIRSVPTFRQNGLSFFTTSVWNPDGGQAGVAALVEGTVVISLIGLVIGIPISLFTALFLTEYVPVGARRPLTSVLDLLAAVPSLIYGFWGFFFLQPHLLSTAAWLTRNFGFVPVFATPQGPLYPGSQFIGGVLVALMILPTATAIMREVFAQTPPGEKEAALALGGSRWRMIRMVVLPFGRGGIVGGSMLALGRAMGESISLAIILSASFTISPHILQTGANTIGANIANRFGEASAQFGLPALMGSALVLFALTLVVNSAASLIVRRSRSGSGVEI
jgi:phosphate transport system permease protein